MKNDGLRQLGWWHSQLNGQIIQIFQPPTSYNVYLYDFICLCGTIVWYPEYQLNCVTINPQNQGVPPTAVSYPLEKQTTGPREELGSIPQDNSSLAGMAPALSHLGQRTRVNIYIYIYILYSVYIWYVYIYMITSIYTCIYIYVYIYISIYIYVYIAMTKICSIAHIEIYGMLLESHVYIYIYISYTYAAQMHTILYNIIYNLVYCDVICYW